MKVFVFFLAFALFSVCERPPSADVDHSKHDHTNTSPGAMDHSKMGTSPGAAEAPHQLQFLDTMVAHHQAAVDMALLAETRTQRGEIKKLAQDIMKEQRRETAQMLAWRGEWFAGMKPAVNMEFPGMKTGMSGMSMEKLRSLKANEFDVEFLRQMIPHHEGAVEMANALKSGDDRPELRQLAESIVRSQTAEIAQMKNWLAVWSANNN